MEIKQYSRRNFITTAVGTGIAASVTRKNVDAAETKKTALFVWGGWQGHEPKKCVDIFAPWLEKQDFSVEISTTLDSYLDRDKMMSLNLIVQVFTGKRC